MRSVCLAVSAAAVTVSAAAADPYGSPRVIYATPPVTIVVPPTGYVLDPSDTVNPVYVVNRGPILSGPGIYTYTNRYYVPTYARPTYSEGGYAYTDPPYYRWSSPQPYPYVKSRPGWHCGGYDGCRPIYTGQHRLGHRPYGHPPYSAYRYRPAPTARVLNVPSRGY